MLYIPEYRTNSSCNIFNFLANARSLLLKIDELKATLQMNEVSLAFIREAWLKGKWQQKILLSHLKETLKQYIEVYYKIFISVSPWKIFLPESTDCPPSWINFSTH